MIHGVVFTTTLATVTLAAIIDIYTHRIPNFITVPAFCIGLLLHSLQNGWVGVLNGLLGFFIGFSIFFLLWLLGGKGAGDAKLIGAVGALIGWEQLLRAFVLTAFVGGFLAILYILKKEAVQQTLSNLAQFPAHAMQRLARRNFDPASSPLTLQSPTAIKFPYGVPIAVGTMLSFFIMR